MTKETNRLCEFFDLLFRVDIRMHPENYVTKRDVKIAFSNGWKKSKISTKAEGYHNDCTVSILRDVPKEISNKELIDRWDSISLLPSGHLKTSFHYYELLDAETTAKETYRCEEHNKGDWAK